MASVEFLLLRLARWVEYRALRLTRYSNSVPTVACETIRSRMVLYTVSNVAHTDYATFNPYADAVIPEGNIILLPLVADVNLLRCADDLVQVADNGVTFSLGDSNDAGDEARIEEQ